MRACSSSAAYKQDICTARMPYILCQYTDHERSSQRVWRELSIDNGIHYTIIDNVKGNLMRYTESVTIIIIIICLHPMHKYI